MIRTRSGDSYKSATLRSHEQAMRLRVLPAMGRFRLADIARPDLQRFANDLLASGMNPSTIAGTIQPLRVVFDQAVHNGDRTTNPTSGLRLPAVRSRNKRFASPEEAEALIAAAPTQDRAVWATAFYAGLRLGELQALRVEDVDLATGIIRVERGWDAKDGEITPKSDKGRRRVPIPGVLREHLLDHLARVGRSGPDLVFGRSRSHALCSKRLQERADASWRRVGLERITPHPARHTFASFMIAAGVNAKALQTFLGHASITETYDRYGHLMPGSEAEAAGLLDSYLNTQVRHAEDQARAAPAELASASSGTRLAPDPEKPLG